ncbi:MAG: T9SS type A sorting domain-containing protein [Chitinophagaceae bacterium]|nr:T9SS type A sorting domain-containing protein [Chitinophagaceae bacterium]MCB9045728.1 T9SS type A sorting domain-containing protein [Chitinophagales bacterium]
MKTTCLLLWLLTLYVVRASGQQNHVPNGNFEEVTSCPSDVSQVGNCKGWIQYTIGTPDYFNSCTNNIYISTPENSFGWQKPANGEAYVGMYTYTYSNLDFKEYVARQIIPLVPGTEYEVSMSVSLANKSMFATNGLGAYFFESGPGQVSQQSTLKVTPQVLYNYAGTIKDTANWVRLSQVFMADSAYNSIIIGCFLDSSHILKDTVAHNFYNRAYYYIDSVVVKILDTFSIQFADTNLCAGDTITVAYRTVLQTQNNNVFTIQLSDASGSFVSPVDIGTMQANLGGTIRCIIPPATHTGNSYRIRATSTAPADTTVDNGFDISITGIDKPVAENDGPVCTSDTLRLSATSTTAGVEYSWIGPSGFSCVQRDTFIIAPVNANSGDYIVTTKINGCASSDTTTVSVYEGNRATNIRTSGNTPVCVGDTIHLSAIADGVKLNYLWSGPAAFVDSGQDLSVFAADTSMSGNYFLSVGTDACFMIDTIKIKVNPLPEKPLIKSNSPLEVHETLTLELNNPVKGATVLWKGPAGFTAHSYRASIPNVKVLNAGSYILIENLEGCIDSSTISVEINESLDTGMIVIYPNPSNGTFTIEGYVYNDSNIPMVVFSEMGNLTYKQDIVPDNKVVSEKVRLPGHIAPGIYFIELFVDRKTILIPISVVK